MLYIVLIDQLFFVIVFVILVQIIKRQFRIGRNCFESKERELVNFAVATDHADDELAAIGITAVVDEASRTAHELAIDDVEFLGRDIIRFSFDALEFVERVQVRVFALDGGVLAAGRFGVGDNLTEIGVDKFALADCLGRSEACMMLA